MQLAEKLQRNRLNVPCWSEHSVLSTVISVISVVSWVSDILSPRIDDQYEMKAPMKKWEVKE